LHGLDIVFEDNLLYQFIIVDRVKEQVHVIVTEYKILPNKQASANACFLEAANLLQVSVEDIELVMGTIHVELFPKFYHGIAVRVQMP
jgi:hypothetical protein